MQVVVRAEDRKRGSPICQMCRRAIREQAIKTGKVICSKCSRTMPAQFDKRGWLKGSTCTTCEYKASPRKRRRDNIESRKRRDARYATWDGVTDREIYNRDEWTCRVPECLNPEGRAITRVSWPDPWSAAIDHVIPLSLGGADTADNKRAAHMRCNGSRGNWVSEDELAAYKESGAYEAAVAVKVQERERKRAIRAQRRAESAALAAERAAERAQRDHPERREAYRLRVVEGLKWKDVAERLGYNNTGQAYLAADAEAKRQGLASVSDRVQKRYWPS
jgi:5-methylcytosine-specific restriction endonuclease McrA